MSNLNTRSTSGIRKARDFGHDEEFDQIRIRKKSSKADKSKQTLFTDSDSGNDDDLKLLISKSHNSSRNVDSSSSHKKSKLYVTSITFDTDIKNRHQIQI